MSDFGTTGLSLSAAQSGVWFAQQLDQAGPMYNIGEYLEILGPVEPVTFQEAVRQAVLEAESLHARFVETGDEVRQVIEPTAPCPVPLVDVSAEEDPRRAAEAWMHADLTRPADLAGDPLFATALFQVSSDRFFWYQRAHHIALDAYGLWLMARRVAEVYTAMVSGTDRHAGAFGSLRVLLEHDAAYRESDQLAGDRRFWLTRFADRPRVISLTEDESPLSRSFLRTTTHVTPAELDKLTPLASGGREP
jgi:nonribosomal peptide synthetase DhbF